MKAGSAVIASFIVAIAGFFGAASASAQKNNWYALGGNCELGGAPYALAMKILPTSKRLFIGGGMALRSDPGAKCVLGWNGTSYELMGSGLSGTVYAMTLFQGDLYVGGNFSAFGGVANATNIAYWDGVSWNALGSGLNSWVKALVTDGTSLYVGGNFTASGGTSLKKIARWDGYSWSTLGPGVADSGEVRALAIMGSSLYAGGSFLDGAGIAEADRIMRWNGSQWYAVDSRLASSESVDALAAGNGGLYVGGDFSQAGGVSGTENIALYTGSSWQALNSGLPSYVKAITIGSEGVYVGGAFSSADGDANCSRIARWDGGGWHSLGTGLNATVFAIVVDGYDVYAGGSLSMAGGNQCADYVARYNDHYVEPTIAVTPPLVATVPADDSTALEVEVFDTRARAGQPAKVKFQVDEIDPSLAGKVKILIKVMRNRKVVMQLLTTLVVDQLGEKQSKKLRTAGLRPGKYKVCVRASASFSSGKESVQDCGELILK